MGIESKPEIKGLMLMRVPLDVPMVLLTGFQVWRVLPPGRMFVITGSQKWIWVIESPFEIANSQQWITMKFMALCTIIGYNQTSVQNFGGKDPSHLKS